MEHEVVRFAVQRGSFALDELDANPIQKRLEIDLQRLRVRLVEARSHLQHRLS